MIETEPTPADVEQYLAQSLSYAELAAEERAANGIGRAWSAGELLRSEFPAVSYVVPDLIPPGLSILGGRPKIGKSWFLLQLAISVGTGGVVLERRVERRRVLVLALEDSARRLKDRLQKLGCPTDADITFVNEFPNLLHQQGALHLASEIERCGYGLCIVDTYARFAAIRKAEDEARAGELMGGLQRIVLERGVALVVADHHRKAALGAAQDVIDDVMGNTAKTGVLDAVMGLYRQRGQVNAELKVSGREIEEREFAVRFDKQLMCWQLVGDADHVRANTLQSAILDAMTTAFGNEATVTQLARFLGKAPSNVAPEMAELLAAGQVERLPKRGQEVPYRRVFRIGPP